MTRLKAYVAGTSDDELDELTQLAFAFQYERVLPLRRLCEARGIGPANVHSWRDLPPVPTAAFKSLRLCAAPPQITFRSSGTTGGERRAQHHHPFPDLYRAVIDASFPRYCLSDLERPPMLSLVPSRELVPDSSLAFMIDHVLTHHAGAGSTVAIGRAGVDTDAAAGWLEAAARAARPVMILATALALVELLEVLLGAGTGYLLPPGSVLFETGGFKGRKRQIDRPRLLEMIEEGLGLPASAVVREYGMTELTSQAYTEVLRGGDPDLFFCPPWLRVQILEPVTLLPATPGEVGLVALFDLANVGSALHLLTEDLGELDRESGGFRLHGRAVGAELRGCSLTVEELSQA